MSSRRTARTPSRVSVCSGPPPDANDRPSDSALCAEHGFSPDAFVQMAYQAAYYSLYGRVESTYEPAMTKAFLHGRTEAIRSVTPE